MKLSVLIAIFSVVSAGPSYTVTRTVIAPTSVKTTRVKTTKVKTTTVISSQIASSSSIPFSSEIPTTEVPSSSEIPTTTEVPSSSEIPTTTEVPTSSEIPTTEIPTSTETTRIPTTTQPPLPTTPANVSIKSIVSAGSGCPAGSARASINSNGSHLAISHDPIQASKGPSVPITESRKNCQVNLNLSFESGWQYRLNSVQSRGYYQLENGVTATQKFTNYYSGEVEQQTAQKDISSGESNYSFVEMFRGEVWSPCNKDVAVNINSQVRVAGSGSGYIVVDPVEGDTIYKVSIDWRRC
ncbi:hypothetical protein HDU92_003191 [Lobulomyces angularis]|nr:hypothetical protein HDU92_003191 [Lobulomyces angularis]